jgi:hypothetical protein
VSNYFRQNFLGKSAGLKKAKNTAKVLDMKKPAKNLPPARSHQWIDYVDLMAHRAMARKIRRQPNLFSRVRRNITRWEKRNRGCPAPLREWKQILRENDMAAVLRIVSCSNAEGDRLRQSSPFCGILTEKERTAIWARYDQSPT